MRIKTRIGLRTWLNGYRLRRTNGEKCIGARHLKKHLIKGKAWWMTTHGDVCGSLEGGQREVNLTVCSETADGKPFNMITSKPWQTVYLEFHGENPEIIEKFVRKPKPIWNIFKR